MAGTTIEQLSRAPEATEALGVALAHLLRPHDVVRLEGELGAGKTALVRGIARGLGVGQGLVSSPTFVVINLYPIASHQPAAADDARIDGLIHIDAYRVSSTDELENVGWDHLFDPGTARPRGKRAAVIEWPERVEAVLPPVDECAVIRLSHTGEETRRLELQLPSSWESRPGYAALRDRPAVLCPVRKVWVAPTNPSYPFFDERARNADLYQWLVGPKDEE
jgi:tRNA threonylcarbamoyladenosine biosynthesis protein TsaE